MMACVDAACGVALEGTPARGGLTAPGTAGVPHFRQNRAPSRSGAPHCPQAAGAAGAAGVAAATGAAAPTVTPQAPQKAAPSGSAAPQLEQDGGCLAPPRP